MKKEEYIARHGIEKYQERLRKLKEYRDNHKEEMAEYRKQYRDIHKEEMAEYHKQYYQNHRKELLENSKQYGISHKEERAEYQKQYRDIHKEKIKQYRDNHREEKIGYDKKHYQKYREEILESQKQYRQTQYGRAAHILDSYRQKDKSKGYKTDLTVEWIVDNIFNSKCYYCEETDWAKLGLDRIDNTKGHTMDNCICACQKCNAGRGNRYTVEEFRRYKQIRPKIA